MVVTKAHVSLSSNFIGDKYNKQPSSGLNGANHSSPAMLCQKYFVLTKIFSHTQGTPGQNFAMNNIHLMRGNIFKLKCNLEQYFWMLVNVT